MNSFKKWPLHVPVAWKKAFLIWLVASLSACALSPQKEQAKKQSDDLLQTQLQEVQAQLSRPSTTRSKHVFLGSAQHSQSLVFQRDIVSMAERLKTLNPDTATILLSNQMETQQLSFPFATRPNLDRVFTNLAAWSQVHPLSLTVLISTHGSPDVLSVNIANQYFQPLRSAQLKVWLDKLHARTKITLLLSACYSGSFVDALRAENRMILTAAAANRNSFGCHYHDRNTWFIGQLLGPHFSPQSTWDDVFTATRAGIARQEKFQQVSPPSNPQIDGSEQHRKMTLKEWFSIE